MTSLAGKPYVGRFAPTPSGPLHAGSLVAAMASWLDARVAGGRWLLRVDDIDRTRSVPGAEEAIVEALLGLGFCWDGPIARQSEREPLYAAALARLLEAGSVFGCACTRREVDEQGVAGVDGATVYPGTCRNGIPDGRAPRADRFRVGNAVIEFTDRWQGRCRQDVGAAVGDFVIRRADGLFAYQLAVVVDDHHDGVTDVVRGADLLDSTARQILISRSLGFAVPRYLHVPLVVNAAGEKLSKQTRATAIGVADPVASLQKAAAHLGLGTVDADSVNDFWSAATAAWALRIQAETTEAGD